MPTGNSEFSEVFFDVVIARRRRGRPIDGAGPWPVPPSATGVSIGGGQGGMMMPGTAFIPSYDAHPSASPAGRCGSAATWPSTEAIAALNLRSAHRAVEGGGEPGPEGAITKLVLSEIGRGRRHPG